MADLLQEAKELIELSVDGSGQVRMLEVYDCLIFQGPDIDAPLESINKDFPIYRLEEIPKDEINLSKDEMLIPVAHIKESTSRRIGIPFVFKFRNGELFSQMKKRLFAMLDLL